MNDGSGPLGGAYLDQHLDAAAYVTGTGRRAHRSSARPPPGLLLALRTTPGAVARARRQRPPRAAGPGGRALGRAGPDRLRLRPHGGRLRPRHRGDGDRRAARPRRRTCCDARAPTRGSSRWCATCCSSGPRSSAARPSSGRPSAAGRRPGTGAPRTAAPTRAPRCPPSASCHRASCRRASPVSARDGSDTGGAARPRPHDRARGGRPDRAAAQRGRRGGGHEVQPDRHRHRGRPSQRGAGPRPAPRGAARRRHRRRGGQRARRHQRSDLDRRPDRRHRELPLRPAPLRGQHRRRGRRRGGRGRRAGTRPRPRVRRDSRWRGDLQRAADPAPARRTAGGAAGRHRVQLRAAGAHPPGRLPGADAPADPRHPAARLLRARHLRGGGRAPRRLRRGGRAHLGPRRRRAGRRRGRRDPRGDPVTGWEAAAICAPDDGFAEFRAVVVDVGFVHGEGPNGAPEAGPDAGE